MQNFSGHFSHGNEGNKSAAKSAIKNRNKIPSAKKGLFPSSHGHLFPEISRGFRVWFSRWIYFVDSLNGLFLAKASRKKRSTQKATKKSTIFRGGS